MKIGDLDIYRKESWYCGPGPSPIVFPDGEIIVGFRRTRSMGHGHPAVEACLVRSKDAGETWSSPEVFDYGPIRNINLTLLSQRRCFHRLYDLGLLGIRLLSRLA